MRLILSSAAGAVFGLGILTACSQATANNSDMALQEPADAPCAAPDWQALVGQLPGEVDMGSLPRNTVMFENGQGAADIDITRMRLTVGEDGRVATVACG